MISELSTRRSTLGARPRHTRAHGTAWLLALALGFTAARASADNLWAVIPVSYGSGSEAATARKLEQSLRARGFDVLDGASAASEFERRHSRSPNALPKERIAQLDASLRTLADELASENLQAAEASIAEIDALTPDVRDQLNHEESRARRRYHICLLAAHLFAKEKRTDQASAQIRKCARDFPGFAPEQSPYLPESIRQFFKQAEQELQTIRPTSLHVDVENNRELRCIARVNGIDRGPVPATLDPIRTERVRVQVDCDSRPGRIYDLLLEPGDNTERIDPLLDRAVVTRRGLELRYPDANTAAENRLLHTLRIARAISADSVLLIADGQLQKLDVASRRVTAIAPLGTDLDSALERIVAGPTPALSALGPPGSSAYDERATSSDPFGTLAWVTGGAALAAGAGALVAFLVRQSDVKQYNTNESGVRRCTSPYSLSDDAICTDLLASADSAETAGWVLGYTGISLAALAATFLVLHVKSDEERPPQAGVSCLPKPGQAGLTCRF